MRAHQHGNIALHITLLLLLILGMGQEGGRVWGQSLPDSARVLQESGDRRLESGDLPGAVADFRESRRLFFEAGLPAQAVTSGLGLAVALVQSMELNEGRDVLLACRDSILVRDPGNDSLLANVYGLLGTVYEYQGDREKALETALEAVAVKKRIPNLEPGELAYNFYLIGAIYFQRNDFAHAIEYERAARKSYQAAGMMHEYAETGINLGLALVRSSEYAEALDVLEESARLADPARLEPVQLAALRLNTGLANLELGHLEQAMASFRKVLSSPRPRHYHVAIAEGNLGLACYQEGRAGPAVDHLQRAVEGMGQAKFPDPDEMAKLLLHLGQSHRLNGDPDAALEAFESGIRRQLQLEPQVSLDTLYHFERSCDRRTLLRLFSERADLLQDTGHPERARHGYRQAFKVIDDMRRTFLGEGSRQFLGEYVLPIYEKGLALSWRLYEEDRDPRHFEEALRIAERNKAVLLLEAMQDALARRGGGIPDSLLDAERTLRTDIAWYEKELYQAKWFQNSKLVDLYSGYLIEKQAALDRLETTLKRDFPYYIRRKNETPEVTLAAMQARARDGKQAILEFFVGENHIYALLVGPEGLDFRRFDHPLDQENAIAEYRRALSDWKYIYDQPAAAWQDLKRGGRRFYRALLQPFFGDDIPGRLIIIPDGQLAFLPFEALLTDDSGSPGNYLSLSYLIRRSEISYAYSAALLLSPPSAGRGRVLPGKAIAFAPSYGKAARETSPHPLTLRDGEADLPGARAEVQALSRHFNVLTFTGLDATETSFKKLAAEHSILHLAMHGILDDAQADYSHLAFSRGPGGDDGALYAYELEQMRLPAHLVVLSACETGTGQLQKGEGVLSLARGFLYAGAESVVMSLWKLEDGATARLTEAFYAGLSAGMGKSEALRKAKLTYLEQADDFTAHPGFWTGLVLIGDTDALPEPRLPAWWILPLCAGLLVAIGWALVRYGKKRKN